MIISPDTLLPFFFILAIVWGALEVSDVFRNKAVKAIISLVIAFFAVSSGEVMAFLNQMFPFAILFFIAAFFLAFLLKPFRGGDKKIDYTLLVIVLVLVLLFLAGQEHSLLQNFLPGWDAENVLYGIGIVFVLLILFSVYKNWKE
jgi:hypothetical protein